MSILREASPVAVVLRVVKREFADGGAVYAFKNRSGSFRFIEFLPSKVKDFGRTYWLEKITTLEGEELKRHHRFGFDLEPNKPYLCHFETDRKGA